MQCRKRTQVVLALCLLLVLWQSFQASISGLGHLLFTPSLSAARRPPQPTARCSPSTNTSAWFNAHYDAAVRPLLTGAAHELSLDVVQWWLVSGRVDGYLRTFLGSPNMHSEDSSMPIALPSPPPPNPPLHSPHPSPWHSGRRAGSRLGGLMLSVPACAPPDPAGPLRQQPAPGHNPGAFHRPAGPEGKRVGPIPMQALRCGGQLREAEGVPPRPTD